MTRQHLIEQILRQVYNGFPQDDSTITNNYVNQLINQGIGIAVKQNYKESLQLQAVGYVNNSFYTTFKNLAVVRDENDLWKVTLPDLPLGLGKNEGIATLRFKSQAGDLSLPVIWLSENQLTYFESLRPIPNKILAYPQGIFVYVITPLLLNTYTASVTMISGGDSTDLTSVLNVPSDYIPVIIDYCVKLLMAQRNTPVDVHNDGLDAIVTN